MTTTDLLKKFRSKKTGIQNAQLVLTLINIMEIKIYSRGIHFDTLPQVQLLANILKKINPHKHKVERWLI